MKKSRAFSKFLTAIGAAEGRRGFDTLGEFLLSVVKAAAGRNTDERLERAPTGAGEVDPTGGGFLVPPTFEHELIGSVYEAAVLAPMCDIRPTEKPADVKIPGIDETSRVNGSRWGGMTTYWLTEGVQPPSALPKFRSLEFAAKKFMTIAVATNELLADVPMLDAHMRRGFAAEAAFTLDNGILNGTGAGMLGGILSSAATIMTPKEIGQQAGTVTGGNIRQMWSRMPAPCRRRAVWLINEDAEEQLDQIPATSGAASALGLYLPAGANGNAFPLLKGRPVIAIEQAAPLGKVGDIVLADLSQYILIDGGIRADMSVHVLFDNDQVIFRFVWRGDGRPGWSSPVVSANGSGQRSPFVTLSAR